MKTETKYKNMKGLKVAVGGLAILAGVIGGLEIAERSTSKNIPAYTSAKRYIGGKAVSFYLKATRGSDEFPRGFPF